MKKEAHQEILEVTEGCQVTLENGGITVKGEKGEIKKTLSNPAVTFKMEGNNVTIMSRTQSKKSKKLINTFKAHFKNLFKGVTEGHIYKLKICSGHFPMTVSVKGDIFEIKNFIGEKVPRQIKIHPDTQVKVDGSEVVVEGIDKETVGQMAGSIEQLTRRPGFDQRIFQDGIYITEKDGKLIK